jgi:hypothetical protein
MKRGIVVSDIHCGSIYGLHPPNFFSAAGAEVPQNPGQKYLWDCWADFWIRKAKEKPPDFVIFNGDCIDGKQLAQHYTECNLPSLIDQKEAAIQCLRFAKELYPNAKFYFTQGTEYHESKGAEASEDVAMSLDGVKYSGPGPGRYTREVLDLEVEGVVLNAAHHISPTVGFYRATAADREGQWSAIAAKDESKGIPKADIVIRSHVHHFVHVEHVSKHVFSTPCWQLQTRFMRKNSVYRMLPDIGGVFLKIDGSAKTKGDDPCGIRKEVYNLPPRKTVKL